MRFRRRELNLGILSQFCLAMVTAGWAIPFAGAGEYLVQPKHSVRAPDGSFVIEQRASHKGDDLAWQAWICPAPGNGTAYALPGWQETEWCWAGVFSIAPNGNYLLHIQKTGSGSNEAVIFTKRRDGRFVPASNLRPSAPLSNRAWSFFRQTLGVNPLLNRGGIAFVSWGEDGDCVEISLQGSDLGGGYAVSDWRVHYNLVSARFFLSRDQLRHNNRTVTFADGKPLPLHRGG